MTRRKRVYLESRLETFKSDFSISLYTFTRGRESRFKSSRVYRIDLIKRADVER